MPAAGRRLPSAGKNTREGLDPMKTYCFVLDLKDDPDLIAEYRRYHQIENVPAGVLACIRGDGIVSEEIYLAGNRMVMILKTEDNFSLEAKKAADANNPEMQRWEELMWKYQKQLPFGRQGEKWILAEKIFEVR
jgi:L-rhamnose mutarotase